MSRRIVISSGHGLLISGARDIIDEVTEARKVTNRVVEILRANTIPVTVFHDDVTRPGGSNVTNIIRNHNLHQRNLDVSVHFNAVAGTREAGIGVETLYRTGNANMRVIAGAVSKAIVDASGMILRHPRNAVAGTVARNNLGFLNNLTNSVLLEVCFVNSRTDVRLYQANFEAICQGIARAIGNISAEPVLIPQPIDPFPVQPPGQPARTFPIDPANIQILMDVGVINSPDYWRTVDSLEWLNELMGNIGSSGALDRNVSRGVETVDDALELLTVSGVMNSPDYWRAAIEANKINHLGQLIINMANRVSLQYCLNTA